MLVLLCFKALLQLAEPAVAFSRVHMQVALAENAGKDNLSLTFQELEKLRSNFTDHCKALVKGKLGARNSTTEPKFFGGSLQFQI